MKPTPRNLALGVTSVTIQGIVLFLVFLMFSLTVGCGSDSITRSPTVTDDEAVAARKQQEQLQQDTVESLVRSFSQSLTVYVMRTTDAGPDDPVVAREIEEMKMDLFSAYGDLVTGKTAQELGRIRGAIDTLVSDFQAMVAGPAQDYGEARLRLTAGLLDVMS